MAPAPLPAAPSQLVHERGLPAFGMYRGIVPALSWHALAMPPLRRLTRRLHHKRWQYAAFAHADFFIGVAVVDVGWAGSAFAYLFDRRQGRLLADFDATGAPLLHTRLENRTFGDATFRRGSDCIAFRHAGSRLELTINTTPLRLAAHITLPAADSVLAAIAPANWQAHATHKSGALACSGFAECNGERLALDGCQVSLDASNGLLARDTSWRWASAHAGPLGFNLQAGYMGDAENAIWLEGVPWRVGAAQFEFDAANPLAPWRIHTDDGAVALTFTPEGARSGDKNLLIASSRYIQPVGRFDGWLRHPHSGVLYPVEALAGVTEDHHSRW
ncbi:DUF2804 domain-containing protein [Vogesella sp. LIG4]|uniref:DUF2804 domain-containing protein n=1 Tax=Vogesella sp. LIG4 TaxID=1192162 RepID=UPI00081F996F|nr:DUF2804 domain-containing protein [Vogesella sp. LIG4]SCK11884.1 Protein of unknown function [Vogesella sp. LIG4]